MVVKFFMPVNYEKAGGGGVINLLRNIRHAPPAALCESQRTPRLCVGLPLFLRRYLLSLFSQSPLSALFPFNYLRTLSFSVSYLSAVLPPPSALFYQKPGCTPSGHTNASDGPRLSLRNLFSAFRLSVLCVSAVSPSSLYSLPATSFPCHSPITSVDKRTSAPPGGAGSSSDTSSSATPQPALRRAHPR